MLRPRLKPSRRINFGNFSTVFSLVVAVIVIGFCVVPSPFHHGIAILLPHASHAQPMAGADRQDALVITIFRDGRTAFDAQLVSPAELEFKLRERIHSGGPRLVYIKADARARYHSISTVLSSVRDAGQTNIAFLVK